MANNLIRVRNCCGQLLIYASQWGCSYLVVNLISVKSRVDVTINIVAGNYQQGYYGSNVNSTARLPTPSTVYLPSGAYALNCIGIGWGGPGPFQVNFTLNGTKYGSGGPVSSPAGGILLSSRQVPIQLVV